MPLYIFTAFLIQMRRDESPGSLRNRPWYYRGSSWKFWVVGRFGTDSVDVVARWLRGEHKGLGKLLGLVLAVGKLAKDLNDNALLQG